MRIYQVSRHSQDLGSKIDRPTNNSLEVRIEELTQLLSKNNQEFTKALPSEQQLKKLLQHSFSCYDQLDFITEEYCRHQAVFWSPKVLAANTHKLMRVTKYLCKNIKNWLESYSIDLIKRISDAKRKDINANSYASICRVCKGNTEEILLKETKNELLGPGHWRQLFEEELMMEEQPQLKSQPVGVQNKEYVSSVNYLSKVIRQMEISAKSYDNLAARVEQDRDLEGDEVFKLLEEVLLKMKLKLGQKYKSKEMQIINRLLMKTSSHSNLQHLSQHFSVRQQYDMIIGLPPRRQRVKKFCETISNDREVQKLKEQNKRLLIQRNSMGELYASTQQILKELTNFRNKDMASSLKANTLEFAKKDSTLQDNRSYTLQNPNRNSELFNDTEPEQQQRYRDRYMKTGLSMLTKKSIKESLVKRLSLFNLERIENRKAELSNMFEKGVDSEGNSFDWQQYFKRIQTDCQDTEQQTQQVAKIDVGCQWQPQQQSQQDMRRNTFHKSNHQRETVYLIKQSEHSEDQNEPQGSEQKASSNMSTKMLDKTRNLLSREGEKMNTAGMKREKKAKTEAAQEKNKIYQKSSKMNHIRSKEKPKKALAYQTNWINSHNKGTNFTNHSKLKKLAKIDDKNNRNNLSTEKIEEKSALQNNITKERHTLGSFVRSIRLQVEGEHNKLSNLDSLQNRNSLEKGNKRQMLKHRIATEGNDRTNAKKNKVVTNFIFKPQHLVLFGGISQSYSYQQDKTQVTEGSLTESDRLLFSRMMQYLINLKGFKRSIYENVVYFLDHPFEAIQKSQFEFKAVSKQHLKKIVLKLLLFHKKKCSLLECQHMAMFSGLIGFSLN